MSESLTDEDLTWVEACRGEEVIRSLLNRCPDRLAVGAVEGAALQ